MYTNTTNYLQFDDCACHNNIFSLKYLEGFNTRLINIYGI